MNVGVDFGWRGVIEVVEGKGKQGEGITKSDGGFKWVVSRNICS